VFTVEYRIYLVLYLETRSKTRGTLKILDFLRADRFERIVMITAIIGSIDWSIQSRTRGNQNITQRGADQRNDGLDRPYVGS
jgi:hypothetical protein